MYVRHSSVLGLAAVAIIAPTMALAQDTVPIDDARLEQQTDLLDALPVPMPAPVMPDGRGGGGMGITYPGPMGGVQVDASVTKEITPDFLAINAYCDAGRRQNRDVTRDALQALYQDIRDVVGKDGRVRRTGGIGIYPVMDQTGGETGAYNGNMSLHIRITSPAAAERIFAYVEEKNCNPNWDVRLTDTLAFESRVIDDLTRRLQERKHIFEKLLGRRLTRVVNASLYTWVDGYATYDVVNNTAEATATLSVSYDPGQNATIRTPGN